MRILRIKDVMKMVGLGRSTIYSKMNNGTFPLNKKLGVGARAAGWLESDIEIWINANFYN
ncbi:AlpA family transcriptional regulator [Budviciaceae bacterium CWB-B4]|uniref:AlpA family transcriptional regulator n=1 Tax=Limnobaculum xujianqingii TaxID=2738837 RepID=A0A9D7AG18_9GAMM|nr:AlpA family transcriptional regulator [Limnobaculum xujianqingii]MBK5175360.1 AlpA family transcriptional regulator [Limnobaculum xujianqingii]